MGAEAEAEYHTPPAGCPVGVDKTLQELHENVLLLVERQVGLVTSMGKVESRLATNNGIVADILEEQYEQRGTLSAMKWIATTLIAVTGTGVAVAGVVLAIVASS